MAKKRDIFLFLSGGVLAIALLGAGYAGLRAGKSLILRVKNKLQQKYIAILPEAKKLYVFSDFEDPQSLAEWQLGNAEVQLSSEHATSGGHSMQLVFLPAGESAYAMIEKYFTENKKLTNWSGYKILSLDIFNPNPGKERMFLQIKDANGGTAKTEYYLEPGVNNHIEVDIQQLWDNLKITRIGQLELFLWNNPGEKVFYLDNIRLLPEKMVPKKYVDITAQDFFPGQKVSLILAACFKNPLSGWRWWSAKEVPNLSVTRDLKRPMQGRDLFVDCQKGNDLSGDGSVFSPWRTIGRGVQGLSAGDTLLIAAGRYKENLDFSCSGTAENPILIGPMGNGEVIIDASVKTGEWENYQGNIYKAKCLYKPVAVVLDDRPMYPEFSLGKVNKDRWFYDEASRTLYLYLSDASGPAKHEIGVVADPQQRDAIFLDHAQYVTLYGLTVKYSNGKGIKILGSNNQVVKCNIEFNGSHGITTFSYGTTQATDTYIIKNNIYHNCIRNWPRGRYKDGGWDVGAGGGGAPRTYFIGNIVHKNGGEGLSATGSDTVFYDNIVYDNWSVNIYICNEAGAVVANNLILCHDPDSRELYNNGDNNPRDGRNLRRLRAEGVMTADERFPIVFENARIVNNIIIGCRRGITHYGLKNGSGLKNVLIANNTIILPAKENPESYIGIKIPYNNGHNYNLGIFNNLVFSNNQNTRLLFMEVFSLNKNDYLKGIDFKHNLWFNAKNEKVFSVGPTESLSSAYSFNDWEKIYKAENPDSGDRFINPGLTNTQEFSSAAALLPADSPAINAALPLKVINIDFNHNHRSSASPTIGALEFVKN